VNVEFTEAADSALRTSSEDTQRRVGAWVDYLRRWESFPFVREKSRKLEPNEHIGENVYVLVTDQDYLIFFRLEPPLITILDVARKSALAAWGLQVEAG
jgi:hypothetical protein